MQSGMHKGLWLSLILEVALLRYIGSFRKKFVNSSFNKYHSFNKLDGFKLVKQLVNSNEFDVGLKLAEKNLQATHQS